MAHEILGEMFFAAREPGWHGIGISFQGIVPAVDALERIGGDRVRLETRQMGYKTNTGLFVPAEDKLVIVRLPYADDPNEKVVGTAGANYTILQNSQIARALDERITTRWPVETMGILKDGATIFICLDMGQGVIAKEDHKRYCLITDQRDGTGAMQILTVWTRVVCQNTLQVALGEGTEKFSIRHQTGMEDEFHFGLQVMDYIEAESERVRLALEQLAQLQVTADQRREVFVAAYPDEKMPPKLELYQKINDPGSFSPEIVEKRQKELVIWQGKQNKREQLRETAQLCYQKLAHNFPEHRDTGLGVYNTVAELADHTRTRLGTDGNLSGTFGNRAEEKIRAYKALGDLL